MEAEHEAKDWLAAELAWQARLTELRVAYAEREGWDRFPADNWDERPAVHDGPRVRRVRRKPAGERLLSNHYRGERDAGRSASAA
jgi:hypothetical protein